MYSQSSTDYSKYIIWHTSSGILDHTFCISKSSFVFQNCSSLAAKRQIKLLPQVVYKFLKSQARCSEISYGTVIDYIVLELFI